MKLLEVNRLRGPLLIVAPHPDDEVLAAGGLIQRAVSQGFEIHILYLTVGDGFADAVKQLKMNLVPSSFRELGSIRHQEAIDSAHFLGVPAKNLHFLGFPDGGLSQITNGSTAPHALYASKTTGLNRANYPFVKQQVGYTRMNLNRTLLTLLHEIQPQTLFINHVKDNHPDHAGSRRALLQALYLTKLSPDVYSYLIHYPKWPKFQEKFEPPYQLMMPNLKKFQLKPLERVRKAKAFEMHRTQVDLSPKIKRLLANTEWFWLEKTSQNNTFTPFQ